MLALAASSVASLFIFITYGYFVTKIAKIPASFTEKAFIGLAVSNTVISALSLFFPINSTVLISILLSSSIMMYFIRDDLKELYFSIITDKKIIYYSLPFIIIAFIVSLGPPRAYDTGLYHLQNIKWIEEYAVVPGLANLHGRFGFNPNIFTLFACTSLFDLFKQEIFSVNFTLYAILVMYFTKKIHFIFKNHGITNILIFNSIIFVDIIFSFSNLSSPSPNFISAALPLFILASAVKPSDQEDNSTFKRYMPLLILCIYVLTVKLATLPLMVLFAFVVIKNKMERRELFGTFALLALIVLPWLARNIVLTGWLIYPFPSIDVFDFDWKVPLSSVLSEKAAVTGWARSPGELYRSAAQMVFSEWFPRWWHRTFLEHKLLFLASITFPLIAIIGNVFNIIRIGYFRRAIIVTSFLGVLFWLMLAPAFQFGEPFLIVAALSPLLFLEFKLNPNWEAGNKLIPALYILVIILCGLHAKKIARFDISHVAFKPQLIAIPQEVDFKSYITGGIPIYFPTNDDRCYDQKLPCTPYPDNTLTVRNKTLQSGFTHQIIRNR